MKKPIVLVIMDGVGKGDGGSGDGCRRGVCCSDGGIYHRFLPANDLSVDAVSEFHGLDITQKEAAYSGFLFS